MIRAIGVLILINISTIADVEIHSCRPVDVAHMLFTYPWNIYLLQPLRGVFLTSWIQMRRKLHGSTRTRSLTLWGLCPF